MHFGIMNIILLHSDNWHISARHVATFRVVRTIIQNGHRRSSLCNKITSINPREFVFLINLIDLINAKNVEHIKRQASFGAPLLTELPNGSFQDRHCKKAYDSALIATSFISINSFSKKKNLLTKTG